ncbi:MAG: hypothetical protein C4538_06640 [Nitrospiraceae bacterium]|nr:MAG: hypothetical protein C4538_06640 [Nitrospiraceae bacterium]
MKILKIILIISVILHLPINGMSADDTTAAAEKTYIGTVKSAQTSGKYTYLQLDVEGKEVWVATMPEYLKVNVSPGDKVEYMGGTTMINFESKAMGKTFDTILFITRIHALNKEMPSDDFHKKAPVKTDPVTAPKAGDIEKAAGGKTISELFVNSEKLKDQEITLRAKVMKVSKNVIKKNWITFQDGTGASPDDKLTATTTENITPGDIIVVKGTIRTNVNIGAGYNYKILLEDFKTVK